MKVIVVGAGWAGVSAAYEAGIKGGEVTLIERMDMILGTGLVGGIMRNNGRFTVFEEIKAMGASKLINTIDSTSKHTNICFPNHKHANLYDVTKIEKRIMELLESININIVLKERVSKVNIDNNKIISVITDNNNTYYGDVFIDTTGTAGPINNCIKYGNGCSMCVLRCPTFKGRISLTKLCGIEELSLEKKDDGIGAMSGSCKILKNSLDKIITDELDNKGLVIIPLDKDMIEDHVDIKACQQYSSSDYKNNLIILDTGEAKLMTPYYPLDKLRKIVGFENAKYMDPYSGGIANSMRFFSIAPYSNTMRINSIENLFCAGEKTGLIGHTEAIATGILAGYNAVKLCNKEKLLEFPRTTCIGGAISYTNEEIHKKSHLTKKYTVSGSILFDRIKEKGLYKTNPKDIRNNISKLNLIDIFN